MKDNLTETKAKYISRRNFALKIIGLSLVVGIIYGVKNAFPNNYFTCEVRALKLYLEERKINPKLADVTYHLQNLNCIKGTSK